MTRPQGEGGHLTGCGEWGGKKKGTPVLFAEQCVLGVRKKTGKLTLIPAKGKEGEKT